MSAIASKSPTRWPREVIRQSAPAFKTRNVVLRGVFGIRLIENNVEKGRNILYLISATEDLVPDPA
jgi:hypothetical protein